MRYKITQRIHTGKSAGESEYTIKIYHIKVDWETLQIYLKCRDKLGCPMAGPSLMDSFIERTYARRITKDGEHSNPVYSEFHRILWCGSYKKSGQ